MTLEINNNGNNDNEEETQEMIETAWQNISNVQRGDNTLLQFAKTDMSLMQKILATGSEDYKKEQLWRMCNFLDEDEARKHIDAYYEALNLGMDTSYNVAYAFSLWSANRKTTGTNLISILLDTLQHGKWASAPNQRKQNNGTNPRSPLS